VIGESHGTEAYLRVATDRKRAEDWALVLVAEGMKATVRRSEHGFVLSVSRKDAQRAAAVLSAYDRERGMRAAPAPEGDGRGYLIAAAVIPLALIVIAVLTGEGGPWRAFFARGVADSAAILSGELWRTVTALTLHTGTVHVMMNAVSIALFLGAVCRTLGVGFGSAATLLSGAGGNLLNALFHGVPHHAVGASTAIFGAVGLLAGLGVARRLRGGTTGRRAWVPMAAGLGLLAMLGTTGARVDVWAHLFGLLVGGALGLPIGLLVHRPPNPRVQRLLGGSALAVVILSWMLAIR